MIYVSSAKQLKAIADSLKDFLSECLFEFCPSGIHMRTTDPEKIVFINMEIQPPPTEYKCLSRITFYFYIQTLYRVLRGVKPTDTAVMFMQFTDDLHLHILDKSNTLKHHIIIPPLKSNAVVHIPVSKPYHSKVEIPNSVFYHAVHDLSAISRVGTFQFSPSQLLIQSQDDQQVQFVCTIPVTLDPKSLPPPQTVLLKFLEKFTKPNLMSSVYVEYDNDLPFSLFYQLEHGFLRLTIARSV